MTCGLHGKLDTAVSAVKDVLTAALDGDHTEETLEEILSAYTTLKSVNKRLGHNGTCLLYTSPSPRDLSTSRMPSSA